MPVVLVPWIRGRLGSTDRAFERRVIVDSDYLRVKGRCESDVILTVQVPDIVVLGQDRFPFVVRPVLRHRIVGVGVRIGIEVDSGGEGILGPCGVGRFERVLGRAGLEETDGTDASVDKPAERPGELRGRVRRVLPACRTGARTPAE